jgi:PAS domain S-box-containing protein
MSRISVLIVEDEVIVAQNLASKLEKLGYTVTGTAINGHEAVAMALAHRPQLVLMDIKLQGELDGIATVEKIKKHLDVPVIYLTAHSDPNTLSRAKISKPYGYVLKPFDERDLATQIELALYKHEADRRVREQREWLRITLTSIGDAVIATDEAGLVTFINPVAESLTGWKQDEAIDQPVQEVFRVVDEHTRKVVDDPVRKVLQSGKIVALANHTVLLRKGGGEVPIDDSGAPILDTRGRILGVVLVFRDISGRRRAEEALQRSQRKLSTILEQIPDGVGVINRDGEFILSNSALRAYISSTMPSVHPEGMKRFHSWDADGRPLPPDQWPGPRALRGEIVSPGVEFRYTGDDGSDVWVLVSAVPYRSEDEDENVGAIAVVKDITDLKKTEQKLRQLNETLEQKVAERTRVIESRSKQLQALAVEMIEAEEHERRRLADHLHGELQQMLAAAKIQLEAVSQGQPDELILSNVRHLLEASIRESRHLAHELFPQVLQRADLGDALKWIARHFREQFGLQVALEIDATRQAESKPIKMFLFRAVKELLFNVVKHADVKSARIDLAMSDGCLVLTVSDRGRGIKPDILNIDAAPVGLGLLSLRERAQYLGGSLAIETSPGLGSRVTLKVPVSVANADEVPRPMARQQIQTPAENACDAGVDITRVLFVDDHRMLRRGLINLVGNQPGIDVAGEASNGREAIEQVRQLKPDVVVMDVSMPEMDGIEATRHIKAQWPEVRVIGLSMFEEEHISHSMLEAGAEAFVSKTASSAELLKAIYGSK